MRKMAKTNLANEVNSLFGVHKRERASGADLFAEAAKKGHRAETKLSGAPSHRAICRNCIMANKKFEVARARPFTLCLEGAQVNCLHCSKGRRWREGCPVYQPMLERLGKELIPRATRAAQERELASAKGEPAGRTRSQSPALSRPRGKKGRGKGKKWHRRRQ